MTTLLKILILIFYDIADVEVDGIKRSLKVYTPTAYKNVPTVGIFELEEIKDHNRIIFAHKREIILKADDLKTSFRFRQTHCGEDGLEKALRDFPQ